ncbi:flagellar basal body rod protein FlgG [Virgibacillus sp. W0430]|uniref:flagellar basal body rod protein FlgG n=1 Tax=Virgibacillus sp. W0430 TaxID=3391580 RepID=UPI003F4679D3
MLRSMYAGISGMRGFQTKLDVIGNNIANVNTSGFKKGRVTFQDMMSQTTKGAQAPTANRGGTNPAQVGLGSQLGTIDNIHTQGFRQPTDSPLDFSIEGDGMFVVASNFQKAAAGASAIDLGTANIAYTRAGNFGLDEDGAVVTAQGLYLVGFATQNNNEEIDTTNLSTIIIPKDAQSFSVTSNGLVNYIDAQGEPKVAGQVALASFSNQAGLQKAGSNLYLDSPNAGLRRDANNDIELLSPESEDLASSIISNSLEMSNVDLAEEFTEMITAQRGFQANTRIITTSDEILQELVNLKR